MSMLTSQILQFVDFTKTQKSKYLQNETLFFLQIKQFINDTSRTTLWQKILLVAEVTFKKMICPKNIWMQYWFHNTIFISSEVIAFVYFIFEIRDLQLKYSYCTWREPLSGLRQCNEIRTVPAQTSLSTWWGLWTQAHHETPANLWSENWMSKHSEWICPHNDPSWPWAAK